MYGRDPRDLVATLAEMSRQAQRRSNFNHSEAQEMLRNWVGQDRRFDQYDRDRLVARLGECQRTAAVLDLDAPELRKGGSRRPLDPAR